MGNRPLCVDHGAVPIDRRGKDSINWAGIFAFLEEQRVIVWRVLLFAVLAGAVVNFVAVFADSPAFSKAERLETVAGGWRVPNVAAHYDKSEYKLELAYGYLNNLGMVYDPETQSMRLIDEAEMQARTQKAIELLEEVVRLDPANASAWAYLAQAQNRDNDIEAMRTSLKRSWDLAPNSLKLASLRLGLVMALTERQNYFPDRFDPLSEQEVASLRRDGALLQAQLPDYFARVVEHSEPIRMLMTQESGTL